MTSSFVDLCNAFCEVAGLAAVPPERDEEGALAARFTLGDTDIEFMSESESAPRFFSRVVFGPLPPGDESTQWDELLETNFLIFAPGARLSAVTPGRATLYCSNRGRPPPRRRNCLPSSASNARRPTAGATER